MSVSADQAPFRNQQSAICDLHSSAIDDKLREVELIETGSRRNAQRWIIEKRGYDLRLARTLLGVSTAPDDDVPAA